jgi:hypothetical protein
MSHNRTRDFLAWACILSFPGTPKYSFFFLKIHPLPDLFSAIFLLKKKRDSAIYDRFVNVCPSNREGAPCGADCGSGMLSAVSKTNINNSASRVLTALKDPCGNPQVILP